MLFFTLDPLGFFEAPGEIKVAWIQIMLLKGRHQYTQWYYWYRWAYKQQQGIQAGLAEQAALQKSGVDTVMVYWKV